VGDVSNLSSSCHEHAKSECEAIDMGRRARLIAALVGVVCVAAFIVLRQSSHVDNARTSRLRAPIDIAEPTTLAPVQARPVYTHIVSVPPAVTAVPVPAPAMVAPNSSTNDGAREVERVADESSEQFRHSRRGDGQHAE
jgi:hypothetical protein